MRISTTLCSLSVIGALVFGQGSAFAGDPAESSAEANALTAKAAALYDEGVVAYKKGQWAPARASFLAAWSLKKHWQIAGNLADCELQLGKLRDAAEHALYYLRNAPPDRRARAQTLLDKAQAGTGTLTVRVDQPGADVLVDGEIAGKSPLADPVFVEPGRHTVEARLGPRFATSPVDVLAGARKDVGLALQDAQPPPGATRVSIPVIVTGASLTGVGLVVGTVLAVLAHGKASDANTKLATLPPPAGTSPCAMMATTCNTINSDRHARDTLSNASMGTFIGAGVIGLATLGYGLLTPTRRPATGVRVVPTVGAREGGIAFAGSW